MNKFLSGKLHKIQWLSGHFAYEHLAVIVQLFTLPDVQLYAKGEVKFRLLSEIFQMNIKNLEEFGCPPIGKLDDVRVLCEAYPRTHRTNLYCAHRKVKTYYKWLQTHFV